MSNIVRVARKPSIVYNYRRFVYAKHEKLSENELNAVAAHIDNYGAECMSYPLMCHHYEKYFLTVNAAVNADVQRITVLCSFLESPYRTFDDCNNIATAIVDFCLTNILPVYTYRDKTFYVLTVRFSCN